MAEKNQMTRHESRREVFRLLFAREFYPELDSETYLADAESYAAAPWNPYIRETFLGVEANRETLDEKLEKIAIQWKISRMARVTRSLLRLAAYEILYTAVPAKAAINEVIEFAKEYDDDSSPAFINGILNTLARENGKIACEEQTTAPVQEDGGNA